MDGFDVRHIIIREGVMVVVIILVIAMASTRSSHDHFFVLSSLHCRPSALE